MNTPAWLDRDAYPFTSHWHVIDGARMHYLDEGPKDDPHPIVIAHGTPTWSFEWRHVIASLRRTRRVIAADHLGFGLSDKPASAAYEPAAHARRLTSLIEALALSKITLVVHDFGGPIGLGAVRDRLDRVERVVYLNSWFWPIDDPRAASISRFVRGAIGRFLYLWLTFSVRVLLPSALGERKLLTRAIHRQYYGPFDRRVDRRAPWVLGCELAGSSAFYATLWAERAALAAIPSVIVWGERDPAFGPAYLERLRTALPQAEVRKLARVGHFPAEEAPDAVTSAILGLEPV